MTEERAWEPPLEWSEERANAFRTYRDLGPFRSLRTAAKQLGHSDVKLVGRWSAQDGWVSRARAYDAHLDRLRIREHEKAAADAGKRHAETARAALAAALLPVQALLKDRRVPLDPDNADAGFVDVPRASELEQYPTHQLIGLVRQLGRLIPGLVAVERLSRNQPTSIEARVEADVDAVGLDLPDAERTAELVTTLAALGLLEPVVHGEAPEQDDDEGADVTLPRPSDDEGLPADATTEASA